MRICRISLSFDAKFLRLRKFVKFLEEWHHAFHELFCLHVDHNVIFIQHIKTHNFVAWWNATHKFWLATSCIKGYFQSASSLIHHSSPKTHSTYNISSKTIDAPRKLTTRLTNPISWNSSSNKLNISSSSISKEWTNKHEK